MSKRLTDTAKWNEPFLRNLKSQYKLFWLYILDECDHAGVWICDFEVASLKIGEKITLKNAKEALQDNIIEIDNGKRLFIPYFIDFQYGILNQSNKVHASVLTILEKYNLVDANNKPLVWGIISPLQGAKDKDKDKDKDTVKEEEDLAKKTKEEIFKENVFMFSNKYKTDMLNKFFSYWSEKNGKGKMRFELQPTFEISKRLTTWASKSFDNQKIDFVSSDNTKLYKPTYEELEKMTAEGIKALPRETKIYMFKAARVSYLYLAYGINDYRELIKFLEFENEDLSKL